MGTRPRPRQAAAAAAGGDGAWEARTGPRQTQTCCDTPATARLRRGRPLTTLQSTKQQPATAGAVERGGFFDRQTHNPFDRQTHNRPLADTRAYSWQTRGRAHGRTEQHLIHMERKQPRDMMPSSTFSGLLPKGVSSTLAIMLLSFCFSKTEPMEKPAMNSSTCTARSS